MVSAFITKRLKQISPAGPVRRELQDLTAWDARLAYFRGRSTDQTPEFEMGVRYRENGIVEELTQDYGTYTIIARLNQLELLPPGKC